MRWSVAATVVLFGCHGVSNPMVDVDAPATPTIDAAPDAGPDRLKAIYDEVDGVRIARLVQEMSGAVAVTVGGASITIDERYSDAGRQRFRDYWTQSMQALGLEVTPSHYQAAGHPRAGDNLEAVLPGASPDSVIVIVHYDSIGPDGQETLNSGADDDMSGMAIELETARILVAHKADLKYTVRFVASDEEELGGLAGARDYAASIAARAQQQGFALIAAIDDEQSGWNCNTDGLCGDNLWPAVDVFSCGSGRGKSYDYTALGDAYANLITKYAPLTVYRDCMGEHSDHFAMWEIGVPTLVYSEHNPYANPHFDQGGGDTFAKIDTAYLVSIARPAVTFQASLAGL